MLASLLALYGLQLANGVELGSSPGNPGRISSQGGLIIGFFVFAIVRAWALVSARDSGLLSAVAGLGRPPAGQPGAQTEPGPAQPAAEPE